MKKNIYLISTNQMEEDTCGSCQHTDNDLGFVSLRCDLLYEEQMKLYEEQPDEDWCDYDKVRSWEKCCFKPSKYVKRRY